MHISHCTISAEIRWPTGGEIDSKELKVAMRALGFEPKKEEIQKMISAPRLMLRSQAIRGHRRKEKTSMASWMYRWQIVVSSNIFFSGSYNGQFSMQPGFCGEKGGRVFRTTLGWKTRHSRHSLEDCQFLANDDRRTTDAIWFNCKRHIYASSPSVSQLHSWWGFGGPFQVVSSNLLVTEPQSSALM